MAPAILGTHLVMILLIDMAFASGFWLQWPERIYQKTKDSDSWWKWLDALSVPRTEQSCVRAIKWFCQIMIASTTIGGILKIVLYSYFRS